MLDSLKNFFYNIFKKPRDRGDKRSVSSSSDSEEPIGLPASKRIRHSYEEMNNETDSNDPKPSVFRILESREFKNPLLRNWRPSTSQPVGGDSDYTPRLPTSGFIRSRDFINNKENAKVIATSHQPKGLTQPLVFGVEDDSDMKRDESARSKFRPGGSTSVPRMRGGHPSSGGTPRPPGAVGKSTGASRKVPVVTVDTDDEVQIVEHPSWPSRSATCMRFTSDPLLLSERSTTRYRASGARNASLQRNAGLHRNGSHTQPHNKPFWEVGLHRPKSILTEQVCATEKRQFEQLISMYSAGSKTNRVRPILTPSRVGAAKRAESRVRNVPVFTIDGDVPAREVIELRSSRVAPPTTLATKIAEELQVSEKPPVRRNTLEDVFLKSNYYDSKLLATMRDRYLKKSNDLEEKLKEPTIVAESLAEHNRMTNKKIEESLRRRLSQLEVFIDDTVSEVPKLPVLTPDMTKKINWALVPSPKSDLLVECFSLRITRHDMQTLNGLNWLNDEVINFYMNLLIERGKEKKYPNVYAHNTFFYPRLLQGGHAAVKRWTRKVDLFAQDLVVVPVHLGVHWCMACIDFRVKNIEYFDSMGNNNNRCLKQLLLYLEEELKDKKKQTLDAKAWTLVNVEDIPQQGNGSDCGMFACMYAEYVCRDAEISFTQENMPYFREKMVYEIVSKKLLPIPE